MPVLPKSEDPPVAVEPAPDVLLPKRPPDAGADVLGVVDEAAFPNRLPDVVAGVLEESLAPVAAGVLVFPNSPPGF